MIFLIIISIIIILIILLYNSIINLRNFVHRSKSAIDVYLQQRFDLIPNLVEITKGYMNYEKQTLEKITSLRTSYTKTKDNTSMQELNKEYINMLGVIENYPELKANEQFLKLQKTLIKTEGELQAARRIYNNDVTEYNNKISIFPNNIIAKILGFKEIELFVLEGEEKINIIF